MTSFIFIGHNYGKLISRLVVTTFNCLNDKSELLNREYICTKTIIHNSKSQFMNSLKRRIHKTIRTCKINPFDSICLSIQRNQRITYREKA